MLRLRLLRLLPFLCAVDRGLACLLRGMSDVCRGSRYRPGASDGCEGEVRGGLGREWERVPRCAPGSIPGAERLAPDRQDEALRNRAPDWQRYPEAVKAGPRRG